MYHLKELRLARNITQAQVACALNISRVAYTNLENGKRDPDTSTLAAIASFYGVTVDYILGIEQAVPQSQDGQVDELTQLCSRLTPENQEKAASYLRYLLEREQRDTQQPLASQQD